MLLFGKVAYIPLLNWTESIGLVLEVTHFSEKQ